MTLCPIAIVASCKQCPVFKVCPLKGVLGDHISEKDAPVQGKSEKVKAARSKSK